MKDLNAKISEIAQKEKELLERKSALREKIESLFKEAAAEEEAIMAKAALSSAAEKEKLLDESRKRAEAEVREMLLSAEIEAKKEAVVFRQKSGTIASSLFRELEGYLKN